MMYFNAKSSINHKQIKDRLKKIGQSGIELQLFEKDSLKDIMGALYRYIDHINVIHPPLDISKDGLDSAIPYDYPASHKVHERYLNEINKIAAFETEKKLRYVLHINQGRDRLKANGQYDWLIKSLRKLGQTYENIIFCLENVTTLDQIEDPYTVADIVRDAAHPNIKLCIDTCHLQYDLYANRLLQLVRPVIPENGMKEMFKKSQGILGLIHLNQCGNSEYDLYGMGINHGKGFTAYDQADIKMLKDIIDTVLEYEGDRQGCQFTIEVKECDYDRADAYFVSHMAVAKSMGHIIGKQAPPYI